jgi:hypothetical protein
MFKSDYGDTIADWIVNITTYISKDKALGPNSVNPFSPYQIYTSFEGDIAHPQACRFLKQKHHIHSSYERNIIERTMHYIKDRTESFDDYFPCRKKKCKQRLAINWLNLFVNLITRN